MKKAISILLAVAMLLSLCACSRNKRSAMTIKPSEFSKETQEVLGPVSYTHLTLPTTPYV